MSLALSDALGAALELRAIVDKGDGSGDDPAPTNTIALLGAALKEAGIEDGRLPGTYTDEGDGHAGCPWRSSIRREGFTLKGGRHPSYADAALRILEAYQKHPAYAEAGRFMLAAGKHVNAEQLARLVEAARADAGRCLAPGARTGRSAPPHRSAVGPRLHSSRVRSDRASAAGAAPLGCQRPRWPPRPLPQHLRCPCLPLHPSPHHASL